MFKILKNHSFIYYILLVLITLFISRELFTGIFTWGDYSYYSGSSIEYSFEKLFYAWSDSNLGTSPRMSFSKILPLIFTLLGLGNDYIIYILFRLLPIFLIPTTVFYFLTRKNKVENSLDLLPQFITSVFTIVNPIIIGDIKNGQTLWVYPFIASSIYFSREIFFENNFNLKKIILFALSLFFVTGFLPPLIVPFIFVITFLSILFTFFSSKKDIVKKLMVFTFSMILFGLLSLPYLLIATSGQEAFLQPSLIPDYLHNYSKANFNNLIRFSGNRGGGQETLGFNDFSILNIIGYTIPLISLWGVSLMFTNYFKYKYKFDKSIIPIVIVYSSIIIFTAFLSFNTNAGIWLFESFWFAASIRNPSKLFLIQLLIFVFILNKAILYIFNNFNLRKKVIASCLLLIIIFTYSWPTINGDFGLFYNSNKSSKGVGYLIPDIVEDTNGSEGKTLLLPLDHEDELRFETISDSLNLFRLGGGYQKSDEVKSRMINSLSNFSADFFKYINVTGVENIVLKKGIDNETTNPFSIFPINNSYESTFEFLSNNLEIKTDKEGYTVFKNQNFSKLINSSARIASIENYEAISDLNSIFDTGVSVINNNDSKLSDKYGEVNCCFNGISLLRNPEIIDLIVTKEKIGESYIINISKVSERLDRSNVLLSRRLFDSDVFYISINDIAYDFELKDEFKTTVKSGDIKLEFFFEKNINKIYENKILNENSISIGNASINKPGDPEISYNLEDQEDGSKQLSLQSKNHKIYSKFKMPKFEKNSSYLINFETINISGNQPTINIVNEDTELNVFTRSIFQDENKLKTFLFHNDSDEDIDSSLYFYTESENNNLSINTIDNLSTFKVEYRVIDQNESRSYDQSIDSSKISTFIRQDDLNNENIVRNNSFDSGDESWEFGNFSDGDFSYNIDEKDETINLQTKNTTGYAFQKLLDFKTNTNYKLNLKYRNLSGLAPNISIWQSGVNKSIPFIKLDNKDDWTEFSTEFQTLEGANSIYIYLYSVSNNGVVSVNEFDDISIVELPRIYTTIDKTEDSSLNSDIEIVEYNQINPTKFTITTKGQNGLIEYNESFHKGWKLRNQNDESVDIEHVVLNSFANGWLIESSDSTMKTFELYFEPQTNYQLSFFASNTLLALLIIMQFINIKPKKDKPKKIIGYYKKQNFKSLELK